MSLRNRIAARRPAGSLRKPLTPILPNLTLTGPLTFAAGAAPGTLIANIGNVPPGATPTFTPNDGRQAIAGDAISGWKVVVGLTAASAGSIALAVAATGANGASATVTVTAAAALVTRLASPANRPAAATSENAYPSAALGYAAAHAFRVRKPIAGRPANASLRLSHVRLRHDSNGMAGLNCGVTFSDMYMRLIDMASNTLIGAAVPIKVGSNGSVFLASMAHDIATTSATPQSFGPLSQTTFLPGQSLQISGKRTAEADVALALPSSLVLDYTTGSRSIVFNPAVTTITNMDGDGAFTWTGTAPTAGPTYDLMMVGDYAGDAETWGIEGDSIPALVGDYTPTSISGVGFPSRMTMGAGGGPEAFLGGINMAIPGAFPGYLTGFENRVMPPHVASIFKYFNTLLSEAGTNALAPGAANLNASAFTSLTDKITDVWAAARTYQSKQAGAEPIKIVRTGLMTRTTDSFTKPAGPVWDVGGTADQLNAFFRSKVGQANGITTFISFDQDIRLDPNGDPATSTNYHLPLPDAMDAGDQVHPLTPYQIKLAKRLRVERPAWKGVAPTLPAPAPTVLWTTAALPELLQFDLDARVPATIARTSGQATDSWASARDASVVFAQATAGKKPGYLATGWDGVLPAVDFDGVDDFLRAMLPQGANWFVVAAVDPDVLSPNKTVLDGEYSTSKIATYLRFNNTNIQSSGFTTIPNSQTAAAGTTTGKQIVAAFRDANYVYVSVNGGAFVQQLVGGTAASSDAAVPIVVGGGFGGGTVENYFLDGRIGQIAKWNQSFDDARRNIAIAATAWAWGLQGLLPAGNTWKNAAPTVLVYN